MTTNQTIDGVSRASLDLLLGDTPDHPSAAWKELRALLDAKPVDTGGAGAIANALESSDWSGTSIGNKVLVAAAITELRKAAQPQGEPVAWSYCPECGSEEIHYQEGDHKQCAECHQEWFSDIDYTGVVRRHLKKLKAVQPAPVAVVLPDPATAQDFGDESMANGWNACLDELKRLNATL